MPGLHTELKNFKEGWSAHIKGLGGQRYQIIAKKRPPEKK